MKTYWKHALFVVLSLLILTGCGIQSVEQHEKMEEQERSVEKTSEPIQPEPEAPKNEPVEESVAVEEPDEPAKEEPAEEPATSTLQEKPKEAVTEPAKVKEKTEPKTEPKVEVKTEQKTESKEEPKEPVIQEQPTEPKPEEKKRTVTIAIYVHSLVANMDKLHPSLKSEKYVPANGIILNPVTYELLSEKDTVWQVLQRAAKEHNIQLEYEGADENVYSSVYIEGINHLYEFSAGPLSGWMYSVNGTFPNHGASQYVLTDGDVIEWHYTVDLGRDLGKGV